MTDPKLPLVFRIAAVLIVASVVFGGWWQRQATGPNGRSFLISVAKVCPAAIPRSRRPSVADTAHALDQLAFLSAADLLMQDGRSRCAARPGR